MIIDSGQGVHSSLDDIYTLYQVLRETNDDIAKALPLYETTRLPHVKYLIHIAQTVRVC